MNNRIPKFDLEALKKDLAKVEEELVIFNRMIKNLLKRKLELEMLIETTKERMARETKK